MSLFRPVNSSESNLYTIRLSFGVDSTLGKFNNLSADCVVASNNSATAVTKDYLSSPSNNNLPINFTCNYVLSSKSFQITYGKTFTQQPNINVIPHLSASSFSIPRIVKNSISATSNNLEIFFLNSSGTAIAPSTDGSTGILGFDLEITGPVKLGVTTGNSNKGWSLNDTTTAEPSVYSFMDMNLGSGTIASNSVIISKNLKLLGSDGNTKTFNNTAGELVATDYINTIWELESGTGAVNLINLIPQKGMVLIIYRNGANESTVTLGTDCNFNFQSGENKLTFSNHSSVILYAPNTTTFMILSNTNTVEVST